MVLSDRQIVELARRGMIVPFEEEQIRQQVGTDRKFISFGVSSYGYDARLDLEFKIFSNAFAQTIVDPKNFDRKAFVEYEGEQCIIPPNSFVLGKTYERFKIPRNILTICIGKSTYARCGIIVNVTPLEPEWEGHVTLEISNTSPLPAKVYAREGICQFVFLEASEVCKTSYQDRKGKYQNQTEITTAKV